VETLKGLDRPHRRWRCSADRRSAEFQGRDPGPAVAVRCFFSLLFQSHYVAPPQQATTPPGSVSAEKIQTPPAAHLRGRHCPEGVWGLSSFHVSFPSASRAGIGLDPNKWTPPSSTTQRPAPSAYDHPGWAAAATALGGGTPGHVTRPRRILGAPTPPPPHRPPPHPPPPSFFFFFFFDVLPGPAIRGTRHHPSRHVRPPFPGGPYRGSHGNPHSRGEATKARFLPTRAAPPPPDPGHMALGLPTNGAGFRFV